MDVVELLLLMLDIMHDPRDWRQKSSTYLLIVCTVQYCRFDVSVLICSIAEPVIAAEVD